MTVATRDNRGAWGGWRDLRDGARRLVTAGAKSGTNGSLARAYLVLAPLLTLNVAVNVMTIIDDAHRRGAVMPLWLPVTLETTSSVAVLAASLSCYVALRLAPPGRTSIARLAVVNAAGAFVFSVLHVALMTLLREAAFALQGHRYQWALGEFVYEFRKDLISYILLTTLFWVLARPGAKPAPTPPPDMAAGPSTFDIRDGASILRARLDDVLAVRAAGNYVEFLLADGRRPLMRASMAAIETALAPHGFVRTHRSWLVNAARVRALTAAGSGDFRLDLGCGLTAPLSRRYPAALARLRGDAAQSQSSA